MWEVVRISKWDWIVIILEKFDRQKDTDPGNYLKFFIFPHMQKQCAMNVSLKQGNKKRYWFKNIDNNIDNSKICLPQWDKWDNNAHKKALFYFSRVWCALLTRNFIVIEFVHIVWKRRNTQVLESYFERLVGTFWSDNIGSPLASRPTLVFELVTGQRINVSYPSFGVWFFWSKDLDIEKLIFLDSRSGREWQRVLLRSVVLPQWLSLVETTLRRSTERLKSQRHQGGGQGGAGGCRDGGLPADRSRRLRERRVRQPLGGLCWADAIIAFVRQAEQLGHSSRPTDTDHT